MKITKKQYWNNFLDNIENIWQVTRYLGDIRSGFTPILKLNDKIANKEVINERDIAINQLPNFFFL